MANNRASLTVRSKLQRRLVVADLIESLIPDDRPHLTIIMSTNGESSTVHGPVDISLADESSPKVRSSLNPLNQEQYVTLDFGPNPPQQLVGKQLDMSFTVLCSRRV
jgi:hypothetical protein